jgi:hypothetical protein
MRSAARLAYLLAATAWCSGCAAGKPVVVRHPAPPAASSVEPQGARPPQQDTSEINSQDASERASSPVKPEGDAASPAAADCPGGVTTTGRCCVNGVACGGSCISAGKGSLSQVVAGARVEV